MSDGLGWRRYASCVKDPGGHWDGDLLPSMFELCSTCRVKGDCLMEALDRDGRDDVGVWGGTSLEQRHRIRRGLLEPEEAWEQNAAMERTTG
jgi:hypothetical protein